LLLYCRRWLVHGGALWWLFRYCYGDGVCEEVVLLRDLRRWLLLVWKCFAGRDEEMVDLLLL